MASTVKAILGILLALGILILFLSSSLIANTLAALMNQHLRYIGIMKLVGARRNQILQMYFVLILAFCVIALLIAVPLGGQGAYALSAFIAQKINFALLGYRIVPLALFIQIAVGVTGAIAGRADPGFMVPEFPWYGRSAKTVCGRKQNSHAHLVKSETVHEKPKRTFAGLLRKTRYSNPASIVDFNEEYLQAKRTPGFDLVYIDHVRCNLHRCV